MAKKKRRTEGGEAAAGQAAPKTASVTDLLGGLFAAGAGAKSGSAQKEQAAPLGDTFAKLFKAGAAAPAAPAAAAAWPSLQPEPERSERRGKKRPREEGEELAPEGTKKAKGKRRGADDDSDAAEARRPKKERIKLTKEEELERKARTLFVGNVPLDWDKKRLRLALREACGEKYTGNFAPIWFRDEPLKEKWTGKLRKAGSILKEYADDAGDAKIAFAVLDSVEDLKAVRRAVHGFVADKRHTLRADGVGEASTLKTFDRKRSVFVGNLPGNTGEADLRGVFEQAGEVHAVRIVRDKETKRCKGIAFVLFKDRSSVKAALQYWGTELRGREIRVTRVQQRDGEEGDEEPGGKKKGPHPAEMRLERKLRRRKPKGKHAEQSGKGAKKPRKPGSRDKAKRKKTGPARPKSRKGKKGKRGG